MNTSEDTAGPVIGLRVGRDQPAPRKGSLDAVHGPLTSRGIRAEPKFHQDNGWKETDHIPDISENPIRMKLESQIIDKDIRIKNDLPSYRYGHFRLSPFRRPFSGFIFRMPSSSSTSNESALSIASCSDFTPK